MTLPLPLGCSCKGQEGSRDLLVRHTGKNVLLGKKKELLGYLQELRVRQEVTKPRILGLLYPLSCDSLSLQGTMALSLHGLGCPRGSQFTVTLVC